jgi:hypothetical protein
VNDYRIRQSDYQLLDKQVIPHPSRAVGYQIVQGIYDARTAASQDNQDRQEKGGTDRRKQPNSRFVQVFNPVKMNNIYMTALRDYLNGKRAIDSGQLADLVTTLFEGFG